MSPFTLTSKLFDRLKPICDFQLAIRLLIFKVFFVSALTKIQSWQSTISLFENEYDVPLLPPLLAAQVGTAAELIFPIFILAGLGGRVPALCLFIFNLTAVHAYRSYLLSDSGFYGLMDHIIWEYMLLVLMAYGHGKVSLDYVLQKLSR